MHPEVDHTELQCASYNAEPEGTRVLKKRRDKSAEEFGERLMVFLGKKEEKAILEYDRFVSSLEKMLTGC